MAPLARQGLCALLAVGVVNAAGALAGTRTERPERMEARREGIESSGPHDQADNREGGVDQVRAGLRGTLDSLRNRPNGSEKVESSALGEALSEAATIELAAVALSSINTFWMSLTPAARSELLQELGGSNLKSDGEILIIPSPDDNEEEDKDESDSEKEEEGEREEAPSSGRSSRGSSARQLRENREDSALLRVLQRLGNNSSRQGLLSSTTSTSTMKPMSSTTIAVSAGSSTIEIEAGDNDDEEDIEVIEFDLGDAEQQKKWEDKSLDKIHQHLAELDLDEADILLAFRAFIRRYSRFLGAYKERLIAFVDSDEFSSEVAKLKGAIRDHDKKHGIKKQQHNEHHKMDDKDNKKKSEKDSEHKDEKKHNKKDEKHHHSSTTSTSTVAIEGVPTTMVAIGASTTTTTVAPEDVSTTLIATLNTTVPARSTTVPALSTTLPAVRAALTAAPPRL
ncbi:hypothetical protein Emag_002146 [Eimeria magna]